MSGANTNPSSSSNSPRQRTRSVGTIDVGDTSTPGLSTMHAGANQQSAHKARQRALSGSYVTKDGQKVSTSGPQATGLKRLYFNYRELAYRNSWLTPLLVLLICHGVFYMCPDKSENNPFHQFMRLSYVVPGTSNPVQYGKGWKDFSFVGFHMIFFTFFREFCMQVIVKPIARAYGFTKKNKVNRFMEQSYSMIYYGLMGPFGLYIMYHTPIWFFNTTSFYVEYPHKTHAALFKAFYLLQASFWAQQSVILMLQIEKPRKDFKELVFHHIVTMSLIFLSYRFHFTWIGLAIYITMDVSDFFLAASKLLNYIDTVATGPFFIMFMGIWIYSRHYLNIKVLYSVLTEFSTVGDFTLNWETEQYKCWISQYITFGLLFALQLVNIYWLFLIFRIAWRYVFQNITKDDRSDDEEEEEEEEDSEGVPLSPVVEQDSKKDK